MIMQIRKCAALAGLALCSMTIANAASTFVTYNVDLSAAITGGGFNPATDTVAARGTFNGYGQFFLTNNPGGANPNVYSGTVNDTTDGNGTTLQYKYWVSSAGAPNGGWENTASGQNRCALLPSTSGASLVLPTATYGDAGTPVTNNIMFQVDMAQQINLGAFNNSIELDVKGNFNGWAGGANVMTNNPAILRTNQFGLVSSNVYQTTVAVVGAPAEALAFKFYYNNGADQWESPAAVNQNGGQNRYADSVAQTLPIVFFSDQPFAPIATNAVTFQVDMTAQTLGGAFDPSQDTVSVAGDFTSWQNNPVPMTNNPSGNTNVYSAVINITNGIGATDQYKFIATGPTISGINWENPGPGTPTIGGNRFVTVQKTNAQVLPKVFFSDQGTSELLLSNTVVTFTVDMTNAVGTDTTVWDSSQSVFINGDFLGWQPWNVFLPQMTNSPPGSSIYVWATNFPAGHSIPLTYKYSINGSDNEAASGQNHFRYIRSYGTYNLPTDKFGAQLSEQSFGNLVLGKPSGGQIPVTWLGRPGVHLQTRTSLTSGSWVDQLQTDAQSATNWPFTGNSLYFRLVHPAQ